MNRMLTKNTPSEVRHQEERSARLGQTARAVGDHVVGLLGEHRQLVDDLIRVAEAECFDLRRRLPNPLRR